MEFRTVVDIARPGYTIPPCARMFFVGSCFADNLGKRFHDEAFRTVVNPFGVMYNPASVMHTLERLDDGYAPDYAVMTLGTNHVYILNETGEIVDNCQKRPQRLFTERELSVDECAQYIIKAIELLRSRNPEVKIILTVSPLRYRKYGYHESQLSKATLLLAVEKVVSDSKLKTQNSEHKTITYFPAYELLLDELRDYRFYREDMIHPSEQAVEYIYERFAEAYFGDYTRAFLGEWRRVRADLNHRPLHPESDEYLKFRKQTLDKLTDIRKRYPDLEYKQCEEHPFC